MCCSIFDYVVEKGMAWQIARLGNGFEIGGSGTHMTFVEASNYAGAFF